MDLDKALFKHLAPELEETTNAVLDAVSEQAALQINADLWNDLATYGLVMLTAHMLTIAKRRGQSGPITGERVGDISRSYGTAGNGDLESTSYGREFLRVRKTLLISPMVV